MGIRDRFRRGPNRAEVATVGRIEVEYPAAPGGQQNRAELDVRSPQFEELTLSDVSEALSGNLSYGREQIAGTLVDLQVLAEGDVLSFVKRFDQDGSIVEGIREIEALCGKYDALLQQARVFDEQRQALQDELIACEASIDELREAIQLKGQLYLQLGKEAALAAIGSHQAVAESGLKGFDREAARYNMSMREAVLYRERSYELTREIYTIINSTELDGIPGLDLERSRQEARVEEIGREFYHLRAQVVNLVLQVEPLNRARVEALQQLDLAISRSLEKVADLRSAVRASRPVAESARVGRHSGSLLEISGGEV